MIDIRKGNARDLLREIADESVNCIITSPPYWGLRAYGTEPQVWANGRELCVDKQHEWVKTQPRRQRSESDCGSGNNKGNRGAAYNAVSGNQCARCNAWRGELGLEPTVSLYIAHLIEIFQEVKRVLRSDGTCWVNLGDSYASFKGASGSRGAEHQAKRQARGESLNSAAQTLGGANQTRPTDNRAGLRDDGLKPKDLIGVPWRFAFAMQDHGWILRQDIIWHKPNPMPESVRDRCTKAHEYIFLFSKSQRYYFDSDAILEPANYDGRKDTRMKGAKKYPNGFVPPDATANTLHISGHERWSRKLTQQNLSRQSTAGGRDRDTGEYLGRKMYGTDFAGDGSALKGHTGSCDADGNPLNRIGVDGIPARNKRSVWTVATKPYSGAHFATFPPKLIEPMVLAGCPKGGTILDPFSGAGTTGLVALQHKRNYIGLELNPEYIEIARERIDKVQTQMDLA
jgi:site-specific DNA-methyltransferase (adenine-specific)